MKLFDSASENKPIQREKFDGIVAVAAGFLSYFPVE